MNELRKSREEIRAFDKCYVSWTRRRRRKLPSQLGLVLADNDKVLLADLEERSGLGAEGLRGSVPDGGNESWCNLQNYNSETSASVPSFVCDRQGVSRTHPQCAPNSKSPDAA